MKKYSFFYRNGLTIVFMTLFFAAFAGQAVTGWKEHNAELLEQHAPALKWSTYLTSGHFISATFENFQSEFLQMAMYVVLTIGLRQLGSAESKKLGEEEDVDRKPKAHKNAPWPVKKGGILSKLYSQSLSICFITLFFVSWALHFYGSWTDFNDEQLSKHKPINTMLDFALQPRFWFETFQNWQSEFISVASIVFFTIYLRQKGSPESKPVDSPNNETGK